MSLTLLIIFIIINIINTTESVYFPPKAGQLYAPHYPYGYRRISKQESEVKDYGTVPTKTINIKPAVEIESLKKDFTDKIQNVNVDEIKQIIPPNIKNDIKQYFKNKADVVETTGCNKGKDIILTEGTVNGIKPVLSLGKTEVKIINDGDSSRSVGVNRLAIKNKLRGFRNKTTNTISNQNVNEVKHKITTKLSPKLKKVSYGIPKFKNTCSAKIKGVSGNRRVNKILTGLKEKKSKVHVRDSIKRKYIGLKSSPKTQLYLIGIKSKLPKVHVRESIKKKYIGLKSSPKTQLYLIGIKSKLPKVHVRESIKKKYIGLKSSPKTQLYLVGIKTKLPQIRYKTACKLKQLRSKTPKTVYAAGVPSLILAREYLKRRGSNFDTSGVKYKINNFKTGFNRYRKNKSTNYRVPRALKKIKISKKFSPKKYKIKIKQKKIKPLSRFYKTQKYKRTALYRKKFNKLAKSMQIRKAQDIDLDYIKQNLLDNKGDYFKTLGKIYLTGTRCGCGKPLGFSRHRRRLHKCKYVKRPSYYLKNEILKYTSYEPVVKE